MRAEQLEEMYQLEDTYWWFVARRRLVRRLITRQLDRTDLRLLDVGCGTGGTMEALAGFGEIWGCDISAEALARCRLRDLTNLVQCAAESLQFEDSSFDVTLSCDVLEHVEDDVRALSEMRRVLRPGGCAVITVPAYQWLWSEHDEALMHLRRYSRRELVQKLAAAGLRPIKLSFAVSLLFPQLVAFRLIQRLRLTSRHPRTGLVQLPRWLNNCSIRLLDLESTLILAGTIPFGASLVCVAQPSDAT